MSQTKAQSTEPAGDAVLIGDSETGRVSIKPLLKLMAEKNASDLFFTPHAPIKIKIEGVIYPVNKQVLTTEAVQQIALGLMSAEQLEHFNHDLEVDFAISEPGVGRFRAAVFHQRGYPAMVLRYITMNTPKLADLGLPDTLADLVMMKRGLVLMVGATGSGKSTVARLLVRFYDVDEGRVRIDGVNVRDLAVHDVRRAVGIVFEDTLLFHDSVAANIAFAEPDADREAIERAARLAGAHDFIMGLPEAYDTKLGERGFSLSGGQRQRIAIARAILADPRVLVLDDATSAVDPSKEHEIRSAMSTVMDGRTTIVIAHRPGTIALADTVVLLDGGRVVASGPHQKLLDTEPRYRAVLAAMQAEDDDQRATIGGAQHATDPRTPVGGD